jgi:hypothetical protein
VLEIRGDAWDEKHCPAEIRLNGDDFKGAGVHNSKEKVEALAKPLHGFEFSRFVV